jgi:hypothetical protein
LKIVVLKKVLIAIPIVVIVAAAGFWFLLGSTNPPVDVYEKSTPSSSAEPESLLPTSVAGKTRTNLETNMYPGAVDAIGTYEGDVRIEITKANYASDASDYVDYVYEGLSCGKGSYVSASDEHWYTCRQSDKCTFVWRKGIWIFEVSAPTETLRDEVVEGLNY